MHSMHRTPTWMSDLWLNLGMGRDGEGADDWFMGRKGLLGSKGLAGGKGDGTVFVDSRLGSIGEQSAPLLPCSGPFCWMLVMYELNCSLLSQQTSCIVSVMTRAQPPHTDVPQPCMDLF